MNRGLKDHAVRILGGLLRPIFGGVGCIISLHRVIPEHERSRLPQNRSFEITPADLRSLLDWVRRNGFDVIRLDELRNRLGEPRGAKFVCFTFDDGYRDNLTHALPIFRDFGYPFAVNVTTGFLDRTASLWWYLLEDLLKRRESLELEWGGERRRWQWSASEQGKVFDELAVLIRAQDSVQRDALIETIAQAAGIDPLSRTRDLILTWEELQTLAGEWHATIGAHTVGHHVLANLSDAELKRELRDARSMLEARLGKTIRHLAYPFGGADAVGKREFEAALEADYETAVTTRTGNLFKAHAWHLLSLPRIGIDGNSDPVDLLEHLENGLVAARGNGWKRVVTV